MKLSKYNSFQVTIILLIMEVTKKVKNVAITHLTIGIDSVVTHHVVAMENVAV